MLSSSDLLAVLAGSIMLHLQSSIFSIKIMYLNMINRTERFSNSFIVGSLGSGFELKDCVLMFSYLVRSTK